MSKTLADFKVGKEPTQIVVNNEKKLEHYRATSALIYGIIGFIIIALIKIYVAKQNAVPLNSIKDYYYFSFADIFYLTLIEKIIWIAAIHTYALKLNRNPAGWMLFAFISPYLALIVIGLSKRKNNFYYEYKIAKNRTIFFDSLSLPDKLKLYNTYLKRNNYFAKTYSEVIKFNDILFKDEQTALETLQTYESIYHQNMIHVILKYNIAIPRDIKFYGHFIRLGLM